MQTLKGIRCHIQSVKRTQKVTRAMKQVAAAKLRPAQTKALQARKYTQNLYEVIKKISSRSGVLAPQLMRRASDIKDIDVLVITSDRGLCGGFNENLLWAVEDTVEEHNSHGIEVTLVVSGKKGYDYLKKRYDNILNIDDTRCAGEEEPARCVSAFLVDRFLREKSSGAVLMFNRFQSTLMQKVTYWNLLPLYWHGLDVKYVPDYIYEPSKEATLDVLIKNMLVRSVEQAFWESRAAELAARMTAMDNATKNADDMIAHLTLEYHKARQSSITMELLDIVGGAEALK
ncbi:MAG: ATP synthase F1 subunit gamma [Pseudomonadota bacterium]